MRKLLYAPIFWKYENDGGFRWFGQQIVLRCVSQLVVSGKRT